SGNPPSSPWIPAFAGMTDWVQQKGTRMATIGFIGLGNMGGPMAKNLVSREHKVKVFDLVEENVQALVDFGATPAATAGEAARDVEIVVTMLPAGKHVRSVY